MTTRENLISSQIKRLLSGLSDHGTLHLTEVETDLVQTNFLLGEAIEKLGASFMAIHKAVSAQQAIVDQLLANSNSPSGFKEKLQSVQVEIDRHVNSAVTGLQFQDMTSQLIGRTIKRVSGLHEVLVALGASSSGLMPEGDADEVIALLNTINKAMQEQSTRLESVLWKAVSQTHMESGDIELF